MEDPIKKYTCTVDINIVMYSMQWSLETKLASRIMLSEKSFQWSFLEILKCSVYMFCSLLPDLVICLLLLVSSLRLCTPISFFSSPTLSLSLTLYLSPSVTFSLSSTSIPPSLCLSHQASFSIYHYACLCLPFSPPQSLSPLPLSNHLRFFLKATFS